MKLSRRTPSPTPVPYQVRKPPSTWRVVREWGTCIHDGTRFSNGVVLLYRRVTFKFHQAQAGWRRILTDQAATLKLDQIDTVIARTTQTLVATEVHPGATWTTPYDLTITRLDASDGRGLPVNTGLLDFITARFPGARFYAFGTGKPIIVEASSTSSRKVVALLMPRYHYDLNYADVPQEMRVEEWQAKHR